MVLYHESYVSNPIREYLQIFSTSQKDVKMGVSNPIREYLQINLHQEDQPSYKASFKPYKGVSSNFLNYIVNSIFETVSNPIREYLQIFAPTNSIHLNTVSNPIREYLQIGLIFSLISSNRCFKPYKGVSSNLQT